MQSSALLLKRPPLPPLCRSCDKRLWSHLDVSRCSPLSNQALAGIVKRQPTSLDLSWTPMAKRQLNCLLTRLPGTNARRPKANVSCPGVLLNLCLCSGLRELSVTGLPWSCLSAMVSPTLPHLRLLDLRWCDGVTDAQIKEIITLPGQWLSGLSELCFTPLLLQALGGAAPALLVVQWPHCRAARDMFFSVIVIS